MKRQKARLPEPMILILDVVRDLVNGSKHFELDPGSASRRRVGEVHTGEEVGEYEFFFHEEIPAVTVEEHWYFSIRVLRNLLIRYFEWTFDDSTPVANFPAELLDAIFYCNIPARKGPTPAIWLLGIEHT